MSKLLGMIQDGSGQISSTRVGKMAIIAVYCFGAIMHCMDSALYPAPSMIELAAMLGISGISTGQKFAEKKIAGNKE